MGEGEPFLNYKNVLESMRILEKHKCTKIAVSTSGYKIREFALEEFNVPVKLQISIHACNQTIRDIIMPNARPFSYVWSDIQYFRKITDKVLELNFALIDGINDSVADMQLIRQYFPEEHIKISKYNHVDGTNMYPSTNIKSCLKALEGLDVEYQETPGEEGSAACGQTRGESCSIKKNYKNI